VNYGRQKLCRIHKSEYAKYKAVETAYQGKVEEQIYSPDSINNGQTAMTTVVSKDENIGHMELLRQSGHPMPGR
jgi:hypothetical protein